MDILTGHFKTKLYTSPNGDFHIYYFRADNRLTDNKVIVKGLNTPSMMAHYVLSGEWVHSAPYGSQFICRGMDRHTVNKETGKHYLNQLKTILVA